MGCVKHSQSLSAAPAKPWVAIKTEGTVVLAHCTCMAGLGEACLHIAAVLFLLEGNTQHRQRLACTSLPCSWLPPSFRNVLYSPVANMDFVTPQVKRKRNDIDNTSDARIKMVTKVPIPLELQISAAGKPVILSLTPGYSEPYIPLYSKGVLPQPLISFF